ncbi:MAG: hypothetical protein GX257_04360 [Clostridiales bacterium]|nr:hypothetical protein [Clostridiales bacterium]
MIYSETDGRNFSLYIDDIPVLSHSPDCPFLSVCDDKSFVNRLLTRIPISGIRRKYISLDNVNYDHERSILRFSRGSRSVSFSVRESEGTVILSPIKPLQSFSHLRFGFKAIPNEPVFGCGGITSSPNLRGRHINIRGGSSAVESEKPRPMDFVGKYSGGSEAVTPKFAVPSFFTASLKFYSFWTGGSSYFDFSHSNYFTADFDCTPEKIVLGKAECINSIHKHQTELYGKRCALPSKYQSGIVAGITGGSKKLLETLDTLSKSDVPISAFYIRDWTGTFAYNSAEREFWDWCWNKEHYPHLDEVIRELTDLNINTLCYINPHLAMEGRLYAEASKSGYLIKGADDSNLLSDMGGFMAGHIDLTNQSACQWLRQILIDNVFSLGFSGVITDRLDYLPKGAVLHGGTTPAKAFNYWPALWTKIIRSAAEQCGLDPVCIVDSGSIGSSTSLISAKGDRVDWLNGNGLQSALHEILSLGLSGAGPAHCDLGAYAHLIPEPLFANHLIRWTELAVFTPAMLTHTLLGFSQSSPEASRDVLFQMSRLTKLRYHLAPYMNLCIEQFHTDNIPPMRHMWEAYPDLENSHSIDDQFMLGDELMVAPVVVAGQTSRQVTFPDSDTWVHLLSGTEYQPGTKIVDAPPGSPPVFYKKGGSYESTFASLAYKTL